MRSPERVLIMLLAAASAAGPLPAQREVGLLYGHWSTGVEGTTSFEVRLDRPLGGWLRHGPTLNVLAEEGGAGRGFYGVGYELESPRGGYTLAPYAVLNAALGMASDTAGQGLAALWALGAGLEWRPFDFFGLTLEERYRVTDRGPHGFWNPGAPHKGFGTMLGISVALGRATRNTSSAAAQNAVATAPSPAPPEPAEPPLMIVGRAGDVVQTALQVIGSPYQWGGTAENGFDCSGLVQYAYARHGIRLPRTSRAQAAAGNPVPVDLDSLRAGDILAFSAQRGGSVTHVGMYVGDGKFIHSSSTGVRLSRLDSRDPDGAYWIPRWVGVRRVLP
jgi:cell wall-associated NlpC family hydrolase